MLHIVFFVAGLVALVAGASSLVRGASKLALSVGISPLVVGLTIVAFGTSSPEMAITVGATLEGQYDIAVGNVIGSNIFNVLFILGVSALIVPLVVHSQLIRQEVPIMIGASLLVLALGLDGAINWIDGAILFGLLLFYTAFLVIQSRRATKAESADFDAELQPAAANEWDAKLPVQIVLIVIGLVLLVLGSGWLVDSSIAFSRAFGVSELIIGLTIVAAGTSMPEVATSITAAIKGERDIAVGNVVGSNTFNLLGVIGLGGMVSFGSAGLVFSEAVLAFDVWIMLAVALACLPVFISGREIARWEGAVFVGYYVAYVAYLILAAQQHAALEGFSMVMMGFVVPLTIVTLVVVLLRHKAPAKPD